MDGRTDKSNAYCPLLYGRGIITDILHMSIQPEELLYDADRNLLATAECLVLLGTICFQYYVHFYRAPRMHSADYAVARCLSVRPSVCHTPVLSLNGYRYPQSFFPYQTGCQYYDRDPPNGGWGQMQGGMKKITIFDQYRALSRN